MFSNPDTPPLNSNFLARNGFSNRATFNGRGVIQPRFGFNWKPTDRLIIRGGAGIFSGGTPDVFLSNSFSNTGQLTNAIDITRANCAASGNTCAALDNVTGRNFPSALTTFLTTNVASLAAAPVNAIDPDLKLARQFRSTLSVNYEADFGSFLGDGWLLGADLLYGSVIQGYQWTDTRSVAIGTLPDGRTRYGPRGGTATTNQDLLMTNSKDGRSWIAVARLSKSWDSGLGFDISYTRSDVTDSNAITSATAGSLYGNNAFLDPNFAASGRSIYEIKDQVKFNIDYRKAFFGDYETRIGLFGEYRSGRPYSIVGLDRTAGRSAVFGTVGNGGRNLLYIPTVNDPRVSFDSAATAAAFNAGIDAAGLGKFRGSIVPKNSETSPDFFKVDLHVAQELPTGLGKSRLEVFADIENVLNLINSDWGALRQVAFPYTATVADVQCLTTAVPTGTAPTAAQINTTSNQACAQYRYSAVATPAENLVTRVSLYQIRVGVRFEF